jgi:uncharacterized protein YjbJ (UPF0337 family)
MKRDRHDRGAENQMKGVGKEIEGKARNAMGAVTGDESEQLKGKMKEMGGKAQRKMGETQSRSERRDRM